MLAAARGVPSRLRVPVGLWAGIASTAGDASAVRTYATAGKFKGGKKDGAATDKESRTMAKLRKKLERKKVATSDSALLIDSVLNPKQENSKGVPLMSEFMPKLVPGTHKDNRMNLLRFLERRQLVETVKEKGYPHFQAGSVIRVEYKEHMSARHTIKVVGLVIAMGGDGLGKYFHIRTALENEAFEIKFPLIDPTIVSITTLKYQRANKGKLYYVREKGLKAVTFSPRMEAVVPKDGKLGIWTPPR